MPINKNIKIFMSMFFVSIGCKILGFLRQILLAKYFGTGDVVDAYVFAQSIPNILFGGILVAFGASYMPLLSKRYESGGERKANEYTSRLLIILLLLSAFVTSCGIIFSNQIASLMAWGLNDNAKKMVSIFLKFTFGYTFFSATVGIFSNYLQYKGVFTRQIIGDYIQNILFITFIFIAYYLGNNLLVIGLFLGYFFRWLFLLILTKKNGFVFGASFNGIRNDLIEIKQYAIPIFIATTANEINAFVDRTLASNLSSGSISALNYAHQLCSVFTELTTTILATILFPKLVQSFATNDIIKYKETTRAGINISGMIAIPFTIGSVIFSYQVIELVLERGNFNSVSTSLTGSAFLFYAIGMFSLSICTFMGKAFYASGNMKVPMICAIIGVIINIIGDFALVGVMKQNGLAFATSLASIVNSFMLIFFYEKGKYKIEFKQIFKSLSKIIISSIIAVTIGRILYFFITEMDSIIRKIFFLIICLIAAIIYFVMLRLLKVEELQLLWRHHEKNKV